jgi:hypothetical protein
MGRVKPVEKEGKKYEKTIIHCLNDGCPKEKECVFFIKYKNPNKELGQMEDTGCECVNWDAL